MKKAAVFVLVVCLTVFAGIAMAQQAPVLNTGARPRLGAGQSPCSPGSRRQTSPLPAWRSRAAWRTASPWVFRHRSRRPRRRPSCSWSSRT